MGFCEADDVSAGKVSLIMYSVILLYMPCLVEVDIATATSNLIQAAKHFAVLAKLSC